MTYIYPLFHSANGISRLRGIFLTEESAIKALNACPESEDEEYQIEEWPSGTIISRFDIRVVGLK